MNTTFIEPQLVLKNVSKRFSAGQTSVDAVRDVTLNINRGELIAIVGPSGSGKTTLSNIIGGLSRPTEGKMYFNDQPLNFKNDRILSNYRNKTVGFIFQNYHLIPHYTAIENVAIPLTVTGVSPSKRTAVASKLLRQFGLETQMRQRSDQLSGGQKQRVAIARALVTNPQIIIADEPTGNLDSKHGEEVMRTLEYLAHEKHITVIMVTHNDAMAKRADRIIAIKDGVIKEVKYAHA
jgi:putative ABC transport system ATP-binding protein